jgi:hypothetical protein
MTTTAARQAPPSVVLLQNISKTVARDSTCIRPIASHTFLQVHTIDHYWLYMYTVFFQWHMTFAAMKWFWLRRKDACMRRSSWPWIPRPQYRRPQSCACIMYKEYHACAVNISRVSHARCDLA